MGLSKRTKYSADDKSSIRPLSLTKNQKNVGGRVEGYALIGSITAVRGRGFTWRYSLGHFLDSKWKSTDDLRVFLKTRDDKELFANSWISVNNQDQNIVGFPLPGNHGDFIYLLCVKNAKGEIKKRRLRIKILKEKNLAMYHVDMRMSRGFRSFLSSPYRRMHFSEVVSEHLQRYGISARMQDIWVISIDSTTQSIKWAISSYTRDTCSITLTKDLPRILTSDGTQPHPGLSKQLLPFFTLSRVAVVISENCAKPTLAVSKEKSNSNLVVGPILLIMIIMGLSSPIGIAYLIRRGIRKREFRRAASARHVFTNGNATTIPFDEDLNSEKSRSDENVCRKTKYRWSPDLSNRQPVRIPNLPPPRRPRMYDTESEYNGRSQNSSSRRRSAWHGLPTEQCARPDGIHIVDIVHSISQSASTLVNFFKTSSEKDSVDNSRQDDDSFSVKSEGNKIFDVALQKVTSLINMNNSWAPSLVRVSHLDIDNDSVDTRRSSMDTRNSSFEYSVVSSDFLTASQQLSSGVNSFDTEQCVSSTSFSLDDSINDESVWQSDTRSENADDAKCKIKTSKINNDEISVKGRSKTPSFHKAHLQSRMQPPEAHHAQSSLRSEFEVNRENNASEEELEPLTRAGISGMRRPLLRMPTLHFTDADTTEADLVVAEAAKKGLLHPWYIEDNSPCLIQSGNGSSAQDYSIHNSLDNRNRLGLSRQKGVMLKYCCEESSDVPVMV
eukprot:gene6798-7565_t